VSGTLAFGRYGVEDCGERRKAGKEKTFYTLRFQAVTQSRWGRVLVTVFQNIALTAFTSCGKVLHTDIHE
jgi:hypothetical protein